ncbi:unnamed protein product, partial [Sphacelaria rigidula]
WVGDSRAFVHGTSDTTHMYNTRTPTTEKSRLIVGSGEEREVKLMGDLDLVLYCNEDVAITLRDVSYVPGL